MELQTTIRKKYTRVGKETLKELDAAFGLPVKDWEDIECEVGQVPESGPSIPHTEEYKERKREQMRGNSNRSVPVTYNGVEYPSITAAAEAYGITARSMSRRLGRIKDHDYLKKPLTRKSRIKNK